jgi:diguanylate cyclase (GGDEF)-like protein/PAS domain S-box-containing protein
MVLEDARLACLNRLDLEAMPDPEIFSRITELTTAMLACPVSLVSIVEEMRQWFLGRTGFALGETPIEVSFCAICVKQESPLLVRDAGIDARFCDNPLVTGAPFIRSYLGVPIRCGEGEILGTLCAISPEPEFFAEQDIKPLAMLAELVEQSIALYARTLELNRSKAALQSAERLFRHAEQAADIGSWRLEIASRALHWSAQARVIHGIAPDAPVTLEQAIAFYTEDERERVRQSLLDAIAHGTPMHFETQMRRKDGSLRWIRVIGERIDIDGRPESVAGIVQDCTEEYLRNLALKRAAEYDRLTGLNNRAEFDRRLSLAMQTADRDAVTVAVLDLDGFKEVNDTLGHLAGDRVLTELSERFRRLIGPDVFLARWGGDEFSLLFPPNTAREEACACAARLIEQTRQFASESVHLELLSATCGIATVNELLPSEEIIRRADLALYKGKDEASGSVVCWDETLEVRQSARKVAVARLRTALDEGSAFAAYQPIVDLETGRIVSFEALLRLPDGQGGMLTASDVFSALLDPVISRRVSQMMLQRILLDGPHLIAAFGSECRIGINLSEADLRGGHFARQVLDNVARSALTPHNLTIEVTETMLLSDETGGLRASLKLLDQAGCTIALDDFGTGFSSLSNLRRFPIRKLKIDREFISSIEADKQSRMIIQAIVEMGRGLGLRVVAEGVETAEQEAFLRQVGCTLVQGYRYGRAQDLGSLIGAGHSGRPGKRRAAGR